MIISILFISTIALASDMSLSKLAPTTKPDNGAPHLYTADETAKAERVTIDEVPFIKFSSKDGAIYIPNLKKDEFSPKRLEQAQCASTISSPVTRTKDIGRVEANLTEEFKPYLGAIIKTIQSKCDNGSDRTQNNSPAVSPDLEVGLKYQPKVKRPGDELESYKAFARPLSGGLGIGKSF